MQQLKQENVVALYIFFISKLPDVAGFFCSEGDSYCIKDVKLTGCFSLYSSVSIACWVVVFSPQIIENVRTCIIINKKMICADMTCYSFDEAREMDFLSHS